MADEVKPGYKTTEFWLSTIAVLIGALLASGVVTEGSLTARIVGGVVAVLAALGYGINRTITKING